MQGEFNIRAGEKSLSAPVELWKPESGCYMRTSWMLRSKDELRCPCSSRIRFFNESDASAMIKRVRKRNVFARHSWENSFYLNRIRNFENKTLIEVYRPGQPNDFANEAARSADILEELAILCASSNLEKKKLLRLLGITSKSKTQIEFITGSEDYFLRSKTRSVPEPAGICVDERFCKRFQRYGFGKLFECCVTDQGLAHRIRASINWLFESKREPKLEAAFVKTSISLESLLIFSESESLARSLSERAAFMLSPAAERRQQVSKIIKTFYDARSGIVHGSRDKAKLVKPELLETVDRLLLMLNLIIASNGKKWSSQDALREWCESERWGTPSQDVVAPFPDSYLRKSLGK
jgi:hypothetical protein